MKNNTQLSTIINEEIDQLYEISFFALFLENYIADFNPEFAAAMTAGEHRQYLQQKDTEATHEFCTSIGRGLTIDEAKSNALNVLLSDVR